MIRNILIVAGLFLFISSAYAVDPVKSADRQAIDAACTSESATAGCGNEKVGTGLLKCIGAYKKANPKFTVSAGCKSAMMQLKADKAAGK